MNRTRLGLGGAVAACLLTTSPAIAQVVDYDDLADATPVTTQYQALGVTHETVNGTTAASVSIGNLFDNGSAPNAAFVELGTDGFLRLVFDPPRPNVSMKFATSLGEDLLVDVFNPAGFEQAVTATGLLNSSGALEGSVSIGSSLGIAALEIRSSTSGFNYALDDLDFSVSECVADVDLNGSVGFSDIIEVLASWGPCSLDLVDYDELGTGELITSQYASLGIFHETLNGETTADGTIGALFTGGSSPNAAFVELAPNGALRLEFLPARSSISARFVTDGGEDLIMDVFGPGGLITTVTETGLPNGNGVLEGTIAAAASEITAVEIRSSTDAFNYGIDDLEVSSGCPADIVPNGAVDFDDLLLVLASWGPCA